MMSMPATHRENQEGSGKLEGADPVFNLCFLKLRSYGDHPPTWIRVDQVTSVNTEIVTLDVPKPAIYRVRVNGIMTIAEVPTREEANHLVERIIMEVSMRICHMNGTVRRS